MRWRAKTETAKLKTRIQLLLRAICIKRDKVCILKGVILKNGGDCKGSFQAHHLVTRGKNVGYSDSRLVVLICEAHHTAVTFATGIEAKGYESIIRRRLGVEREKLLDRAEADQKSHPMGSWDWTKEVLALEYELGQLV